MDALFLLLFLAVCAVVTLLVLTLARRAGLVDTDAALKSLHYWLAFVAPWPLYLLAPLVDRLMAWLTHRD